MKKLNVHLENCYGIRKLDVTFDFSDENRYAIYAPNGAMKSSFAQTFKDVSEGQESKDRIFPARTTVRTITDETGKNVDQSSVLVVKPYDEDLGHGAKTSTLLVDGALRREYEALHADIEKAKETLLKSMKEVSGSKKDLEREISSAFTTSGDQFYRALIRVQDEIKSQTDAPLAHVKYDVLFDDKVLAVLESADFRKTIQEYIKQYNELLASSTYFRKGVFNYYNAGVIAKSLADNGFFDAKHSVSLNSEQKLEISSQKELEAVIQKEKDSILSDTELKKRFSAVEKLLHKNANVREFEAYLSENEALLPKLSNLAALKEEIWKSYLKTKEDLYLDLVKKYQGAESRKREIEKEAEKQRTQWEAVIDIFNSRFFVPFKLIAKNRVPVILGQEPILALGFIFEEGAEQANVERDSLLRALSTGERKALYILNLIFEIEVRKQAKQPTLFVIDDVADSFDYKNKYAIIQYLKDISEESHFSQIILTHNFDFFRTINSRFVRYSHCLMALKSNAGITLEPAAGIRNVFVNDWKGHFFDHQMKRLASIPFMRNLVEYMRGEADPAFSKLTSLLHWKPDTAAISQADLDKLFNELFTSKGSYKEPGQSVADAIASAAQMCLTAGDSINFENKIVLAIATRLAAERYMVAKIGDENLLKKITANQTAKLLQQFRAKHPTAEAETKILDKVVLMTPENIHLNSFMYEPILDMSDEHLRRLYREVSALK